MKGSTWAYGMVRDGNGSRISRPITERTWASSTSTISRCPVSICVVMVRYSFRSRLRLVTVASRRFRTPAGAAARFVAEGLVLCQPTAAQRCTNLPHTPGWHLDAQISAQIYRSVGDELYPGRLLGLLTRTLLQPVVKRSARAATHDLRHPLRGSILRLDPWPLTDVEDLHARGGVRPCVGDRHFFFVFSICVFTICRRLLAHSLSPVSISGATRS